MTVLTLVGGFPLAYMLARMRSRWSLVLLSGVVVTSFITIVIKVLGLVNHAGQSAERGRPKTDGARDLTSPVNKTI